MPCKLIQHAQTENVMFESARLPRCKQCDSWHDPILGSAHSGNSPQWGVIRNPELNRGMFLFRENPTDCSARPGAHHRPTHNSDSPCHRVQRGLAASNQCTSIHSLLPQQNWRKCNSQDSSRLGDSLTGCLQHWLKRLHYRCNKVNRQTPGEQDCRNLRGHKDPHQHGKRNIQQFSIHTPWSQKQHWKWPLYPTRLQTSPHQTPTTCRPSTHSQGRD